MAAGKPRAHPPRPRRAKIWTPQAFSGPFHGMVELYMFYAGALRPTPVSGQDLRVQDFNISRPLDLEM